MTPPGDRDARDLTAVPLADAVDAMERVALVLFDRDMRITAIHGGAVAARGLDPDQMVGRWAPDVVPAHAWETLGPMYARALDGEITTVDYTTDDGEEVYETIICPVYTDGVLTGGIATARSVTEERRARKELAETARQFRTMAETSLEGHCRHRPDGTILWASPAMESLLGYPPETLVGITGGVIVHPDDRAAREEAYARLRETREPVTFELRCRHADGGHRWFEMTLRGSFDDAGRLIEVHSTRRDITDRRRADELREQWELTFQHTMRGIAIVEPRTQVIRSVNPAFARMHGGEVEDFVEQPIAMVLGDIADQAAEQIAEKAATVGFVHREMDHVRLDGTVFPVDVEIVAVRDASGQIPYMIGYVTDMTDPRERVVRERLAHRRFERAFADAPIGLGLVSLEGRWLRANRSLQLMLGYDEEELLRKTFQEITHPDDLDADLAYVQQLLDGDIEGYSMEKRYFTAGGELIWVLLSVSLVRDDDGQPEHFISQIIDISERKRSEQHLAHLADHDSLTGLWNRRRFAEELERHAARSRRYGHPGALLTLDLDRFKYVNDTLGHKAGDDLIVHVAATLRNRLRETDALARLGGDEFAVLLDHVDATAAQTIAQELCQAVATTPLTIEGTPVFITLSAGVTVIDPEIRSVDEAMVAADVAMYDAKEQGRNRAVHYEHEGSQRRHMTDGLRWSQRLHQALEQDGISLHAQPIVDLSTGDVAYHEVLMRLHGDDGTVYEPAEFLPIAERFGYAPRLDRHVIDLAVDLAIRHPTRALTVNLSGTSITDPTLGDWIEARIAGTTCRPGQLVFEITETEAIANMEEARRLATRLQRMGCRLALDDFGSGFASFYHLKTLPIDLVKIDGEFVRRLGRDSADRLVVEAVQRVARGFGKDLVAEHVESAEAADVLRELGVRYAQGYYFGRPGVAETMLER